MTIEDFRKLKTGDKVIVKNKRYMMSSNTNCFGIPYFEFCNNHTLEYKIYWNCCGTFTVYEDSNQYGYSVPYEEFWFVNSMEMYDEKKWLEIQLKEEQERIRQEIDTSNKKQEEIQKKLTELTIPQIGKMYEVHDVRWGRFAVGCLVSINDGDYNLVYIPDSYKKIVQTKHSISLIKLIPMDSSTDNIAKSILEFIKLGEMK